MRNRSSSRNVSCEQLRALLRPSISFVSEQSSDPSQQSMERSAVSTKSEFLVCLLSLYIRSLGKSSTVGGQGKNENLTIKTRVIIPRSNIQDNYYCVMPRLLCVQPLLSKSYEFPERRGRPSDHANGPACHPSRPGRKCVCVPGQGPKQWLVGQNNGSGGAELFWLPPAGPKWLSPDLRGCCSTRAAPGRKPTVTVTGNLNDRDSDGKWEPG